MATDNAITIALETELTPELIREGYARELVSKIQNLRKETDLEVSDRIRVTLATDNAELLAAANEFAAVICGETLADKLETAEAAGGDTDLNGIKCTVTVSKI